MMLHSFGPLFKPWSEYAEAIRAEIDRLSPNPVDFYDHSLVNARGNDELSEPRSQNLCRPLRRASAGSDRCHRRPGATFVQQHRQRLFPTISMLITAVENRRVQYEK